MNPLTLAALRQLSGSEFRSGEAIAAGLGVTRATISNAIRDATRRGVQVERVRGQGYRLCEGPVWLDAQAVGAELRRAGVAFDVRVVDEIDSTNSSLLEEAAAGAPSRRVLAAEFQSAGRGRRGRAWQSVLGGALTFSVLWRFEQSIAALSGLSLVVGLACAEGLEAAGARGVQVKWPNDLQHEGRKVGGILVELQGDALGPSAAVIGIGINVKLPSGFGDTVGQPVADVLSLGAGPNRNAMLAHVLAALSARMEVFRTRGFGELEPAFRVRHALHGCEVRIALPDGRDAVGSVEGTDPDGALRVRTGTGVQRFHSGEVSVRSTSA